MLGFVIFIFPIESVSASELSDSLYDYFVDGASLRVGAGIRLTGLEVVRKSDGAAGKIVQRDDAAYFFSYSTKPVFLESRQNVGYSLMFNLSSFEADQQETVDGSFEDVGTRASGEFIYLVPTAFYQWGDHRYEGSYTRIGIGIGLGLMRYGGDLILSGPNGQETVAVSDNRTNLDLAFSFLLESRWNHWGVIVSAAGPSLVDDDFEIQIDDVAVNLGYSFLF